MTTTTPKAFVFVLMPFEPKFSDVYKLGISIACRDAGAYCERVDPPRAGRRASTAPEIDSPKIVRAGYAIDIIVNSMAASL